MREFFSFIPKLKKKYTSFYTTPHLPNMAPKPINCKTLMRWATLTLVELRKPVSESPDQT